MRAFYNANKELTWSLLGGFFLIIAWGGERFLNFPNSLTSILYLVSYGFGSFDLVYHTVSAIKAGKFHFNIDLLMLLAAMGAAILGEWSEGALLLFLFSLAHALEHYALDRARNAIRSLSDLAPAMARVLRNGKEESIPVENVRVEEVVSIKPTEKIPIDGRVKSGRSSINQAPITGESVPVEKGEGDEVYAGTINGDGALEVITTKAAGDRTLDRIIKLVEEAETQKAPTEVFTEKFERYFVPIVLIVDFLLITLPPLFGIWDLTLSFYRGMALLVGASPCALALGTPVAVLSGIAQAARNGVLIKGGAHLENLGAISAFAFDKTGTLTIGKPELVDIITLGGTDEGELLRISGAVENKSHHPLAQAIVNKARSQNLTLPEASDLQSLTARGVRSNVEGKIVEIGSLKLWEMEKIEIPSEVRDAVKTLQGKGESIVVVRYGEKWLGILGIKDTPRAGAKDVLNQLRALRVKQLIMLTGDNQKVGDVIGKEVGVDEVKANLLPEDKVKLIEEFLKVQQKVAMVGDGVNDAPALAHATVGIAMGGAGTAVALETADVALMGDDIMKLPFAVGLSRQASSIIRQNLLLSLAVIGVLIFSTATGFLGIGYAVILHEGSTTVVILNSLRLLTYKG